MLIKSDFLMPHLKNKKWQRKNKNVGDSANYNRPVKKNN